MASCCICDLLEYLSIYARFMYIIRHFVINMFEMSMITQNLKVYHLTIFFSNIDYYYHFGLFPACVKINRFINSPNLTFVSSFIFVLYNAFGA